MYDLINKCSQKILMIGFIKFFCYLLLIDKTYLNYISIIILFSDIETITQKTGNFKQFDIFVTMLKSGLLKVN